MTLNILICASVRWGKFGLVLGMIAGLAIVFGLLILLVTKVCHIEEDEKVVEILSHLAGANCGGCGCSGCSGFAESLASGKACLGDCKVTSNEEKLIISKIAGLPFDSSEPTVAVVCCNGGDENSVNKFDYIGYPDCINQKVIMNGRKLCATACLGGATCKFVCPIGAIKIDANNVAKIDKTICTSCGACINKCPQHIIKRVPASAPVYCACSSECKGKEVSTSCKVGCIGCGLCAKACPNGAITMVNNLPVFDYSKCNGCKTCVAKCPRKIIKEM